MNYTEIKTSKKMNEVVKEQLIFRDDHLSKYAAKRIEELQQLILSGVSHRRELLIADMVKMIEGYTDEEINIVCDQRNEIYGSNLQLLTLSI